MKKEKMAQGKDKNDPKKPAGGAADRTNRPTTIDLKATEIKSEPAKPPSAQTVSAAPEPVTPAAAKPEAIKPEAVKAGSVASDVGKPEAGKPETGKPEPVRPTEPAAASSPTGPDRKPAGAPEKPLGNAARVEAVRSGSLDRPPQGIPWPLIGVAVAAALVFFVIGLGAAQLFTGRTSQQSAPAPVAAAPSPELLERIGRLETQLAAEAPQAKDLQARLAKLEAALNAPPKDDAQLQARLSKIETQLASPREADPQLLARIAAAEAAVKTLADMTATREKRSDDIAALAQEARERATTAASAIEAAQKARSESAETHADVDALTARVATLEQSVKKSEAELASRISNDDAKSRSAIAAFALRDAVAVGMPFLAELAAVKSWSGHSDAVAALEPFATSGVPTADSLGRELSGVMPAIWKAVRKNEAPGGSFIERLQANAEKIVRIRPAGEVPGDEPAAIAARIESRAGQADIRGALSELSKLPPEARAPAEAWIKKAQARVAAMAAARNISQTALDALSKSGS